SVPDRHPKLNRTKNSVVPKNVILYVTPHSIHSPKNELLNIEKRISRELSIETKNQQIVGIPKPPKVLALPQPIEELEIWLHSGIRSVESVKSYIETGAKGQNVKLAAVDEFLRETQSEVGCDAVHGSRRKRERHTE